MHRSYSSSARVHSDTIPRTKTCFVSKLNLVMRLGKLVRRKSLPNLITMQNGSDLKQLQNERSLRRFSQRSAKQANTRIRSNAIQPGPSTPYNTGGFIQGLMGPEGRTGVRIDARWTAVATMHDLPRRMCYNNVENLSYNLSKMCIHVCIYCIWLLLEGPEHNWELTTE